MDYVYRPYERKTKLVRTTDPKMSLPDARVRQMLEGFEKHIDSYRASLNNEGIWLFLATLGCWGVENYTFRVWAVWITFGLFVHRVFLGVEDKRSVSDIMRDLTETIKRDLPYDLQQERLNDLGVLVKKKLSVASHIKSTLIYIMCFVYLVLSFLHFVK